MKKLILVSILLVILTGCGKAKNSIEPDGQLLRENGFSYKLIELQGKKFITYQSSYDYWELAGPIGDSDD